MTEDQAASNARGNASGIEFFRRKTTGAATGAGNFLINPVQPNPYPSSHYFQSSRSPCTANVFVRVWNLYLHGGISHFVFASGSGVNIWIYYSVYWIHAIHDESRGQSMIHALKNKNTCNLIYTSDYYHIYHHLSMESFNNVTTVTSLTAPIAKFFFSARGYMQLLI